MLCVLSPQVSSSKGNREDRPLDAAAARSGAALVAVAADPDATRIIMLLLLLRPSLPRISRRELWPSQAYTRTAVVD